MSLRIRRGTETQRQSTTFDLGEIAYTTDTKKLYVGDGTTSGGVNVLQNTAGAGLQWNATTQQLDINGANLSTSNVTEGTNLYYTVERSQDSAAALFTNGTHSHISFQYDDVSNVINATVALDGVGISAVQADTIPKLGGDLDVNSHSITGTGSINVTGNITGTTLNGNLGSNLGLNTHNINGTGSISITGDITATTLNTASVGINNDTITTASSTNLKITGSNSRVLSIYGISSGSSVLTLPHLTVGSSNGTIESPTTLVANDIVGGLVFKAYDGSIYKTSAGVFSQLESAANISQLFPASTLTVITGTNSNSYNTFTFNSSGVFTAPIIKATSYATGSYPANPQKGWIIFDSTINHFYGYNGTAWTAFTGP